MQDTSGKQTDRAKEDEGSYAEPEGQLTRTNTQLTYDVRQLRASVVALKSSHKEKVQPRQMKRHVLDTTSQELPAEVLQGGLLIVPDVLQGEKSLRLPRHQVVLEHLGDTTGSRTIFIRNDSRHRVTILPSLEHSTVEGANVVEPQQGSMWLLQSSRDGLVLACELSRIM
jgi:hypothetical protein